VPGDALSVLAVSGWAWRAPPPEVGLRRCGNAFAVFPEPTKVVLRRTVFATARSRWWGPDVFTRVRARFHDRSGGETRGRLHDRWSGKIVNTFSGDVFIFVNLYEKNLYGSGHSYFGCRFQLLWELDHFTHVRNSKRPLLKEKEAKQCLPSKNALLRRRSPTILLSCTSAATKHADMIIGKTLVSFSIRSKKYRPSGMNSSPPGARSSAMDSDRNKRRHVRDKAVIDHLADKVFEPSSAHHTEQQRPITDTGLSVEQQVQKKWNPKKGGLPTFYPKTRR
jgi:hypothetical protein